MDNNKRQNLLNSYKNFIQYCTNSAKSILNYTDFKRINICLQELFPEKENVSILDFDDAKTFKEVVEKLEGLDSYKEINQKGKNQYSATVGCYQRFLNAKELFCAKESIKRTPDNQFPQETLQQIYYGAPGTGKSNTIKKEVDEKKKKCYRTTFHPDSDYSTFVGCYKPIKQKVVHQGILDYDSLVDRFKRYISDLGNITHASAAIGFNYHDSIVKMQESGNHTIPELLADAHKSGTTYDTTIRSGMLLYEEQLRSSRSNSQITYQFVPQAFTNAYIDAWNTEEEVYLIIEEINRGNCAQIFGDLFQLLDRKNGVSEYPVDADTDLENYLVEKLADTKRDDIPQDVKDGKKLMLPSNLYIWATMNTSDQSLFPIDSAFKRRWNWKYIKIKEGKDDEGNKLDWKINIKLDGENNLSWWEFVKKINEIIASMTSSADKQLGYFFCKAKDGVIDKDTFVSKVIFYLWNDVFKDYGFEDTSLFRYTKDGMEKDLTFPDFYDEDGENVDTKQLTDFVQKVMNWKKSNEVN